MKQELSQSGESHRHPECIVIIIEEYYHTLTPNVGPETHNTKTIGSTKYRQKQGQNEIRVIT